MVNFYDGTHLKKQKRGTAGCYKFQRYKKKDFYWPGLNVDDDDNDEKDKAVVPSATDTSATSAGYASNHESTEGRAAVTLRLHKPRRRTKKGSKKRLLELDFSEELWTADQQERGNSTQAELGEDDTPQDDRKDSTCQHVASMPPDSEMLDVSSEEIGAGDNNGNELEVDLSSLKDDCCASHHPTPKTISSLHVEHPPAKKKVRSLDYSTEKCSGFSQEVALGRRTIADATHCTPEQRALRENAAEAFREETAARLDSCSPQQFQTSRGADIGQITSPEEKDSSNEVSLLQQKDEEIMRLREELDRERRQTAKTLTEERQSSQEKYEKALQRMRGEEGCQASVALPKDLPAHHLLVSVRHTIQTFQMQTEEKQSRSLDETIMQRAQGEELPLLQVEKEILSELENDLETLRRKVQSGAEEARRAALLQKDEEIERLNAMHDEELQGLHARISSLQVDLTTSIEEKKALNLELANNSNAIERLRCAEEAVGMKDTEVRSLTEHYEKRLSDTEKRHATETQSLQNRIAELEAERRSALETRDQAVRDKELMESRIEEERTELQRQRNLLFLEAQRQNGLAVELDTLQWQLRDIEALQRKKQRVLHEQHPTQAKRKGKLREREREWSQRAQEQAALAKRSRKVETQVQEYRSGACTISPARETSAVQSPTPRNGPETRPKKSFQTTFSISFGKNSLTGLTPAAPNHTTDPNASVLNSRGTKASYSKSTSKKSSRGQKRIVFADPDSVSDSE